MLVELNDISNVTNKNDNIQEIWYCHMKIWNKQKSIIFQEKISIGNENIKNISCYLDSNIWWS